MGASPASQGERAPEDRRELESGQFSLAAVVVALLVMAALGVGATMFLVGNGSGSGSANAGLGPVAHANDIAAQTTLSHVLTVASTAGATSGYGSLDAAALTSASPGTTFTSGPSTSSGVVSVAASGGSSTGATLPGGIANPEGGGGSLGGGSATLAAYSPSGTCWYLWLGTGGPMYGAETGQHQCQASVLLIPPVPGSPVSSTSIGWSQQSYPDI